MIKNNWKLNLLALLLLSSCEASYAQVCPAGCVAAAVVSTPTPSPKPVGRPTVNVPLGAPLATILSNAVAGTLYVLAPKASYTISVTTAIKVANVSLNLNGSSLSLTPSAGASSNIVVHAANFEIYNGTIAKATTLVRSYADKTYLHDLVSLNGIGQFFFGDAGSTNATLDKNKIGVTETVAVYFTQDNFTISNSSLAGSVGEYGIREEIIALPTLPKNALISNVSCDNRINAYQKSCIGIRMGSATIENSIIYDYIRLGQSGASAVGSNNPSVVIKNTQFVGMKAGLPSLMIIQGSNVEVINCSFVNDGTIRNITIDKLSKVILTNNIIKWSGAPGVPVKALYAPQPNPLVTETGTIVQK